MAGEKSNIKHKSGPLKQSNKPHKYGRHRSKGQLDNFNKGKVSFKKSSLKNPQLGKTARKLQAMQLRKNKRMQAIEKRRELGNGNAPHIIVLVSLAPSCNTKEMYNLLIQDEDSDIVLSSEFSTTIISSFCKRKFTILIPEAGNIPSILDASKVADTILFSCPWDSAVDISADNLLNCLLAQGLPNTVFAMQCPCSVPEYKKSGLKKSLAKSLQRWFSGFKFIDLNTSQDVRSFLRSVTNQKKKSIFYRESRPYLLVDQIEFTRDSPEALNGTLKVSGYPHGRPFDVNGLVHISGFGDFQMKQIEEKRDPFPLSVRHGNQNRSNKEIDESMNLGEEITRIIVADPLLQSSLQVEATPDSLNLEAPFSIEEDLSETTNEMVCSGSGISNKRQVITGTSRYQSAWISHNEDNEEYGTGDEDSDYEDLEMMYSESDIDPVEAGQDHFDDVSVSSEVKDEHYDEQFDLNEERTALQKYREERENELFPDEVDTPVDVPARIRFQRYRGLKSFRSSPWDPKENLPNDYSRIFRFADFKKVKNHVHAMDETQSAASSCYITIYIDNVPSSITDNQRPFLTLFGLLPHEQKMTVMHFIIKRHYSFSGPVRSKERLIFHVGFRIFSNCPIFSQHTTGNKFKFERFLPQDGAVVVTVFAPTMFPPSPVMMFSREGELIATGTVYKSDPGRVILKKVVLSGHPFKINKKSAVLRHMFFNRDDILWFKPVELYTKFGRRGTIKEPLGTHGHMKCVFDGQLKAQDTVCMNLYKRIFPKWTFVPVLTL